MTPPSCYLTARTLLFKALAVSDLCQWEDAVKRDIAIGQLILQALKNRLFKLGNQPAPNATSFSSNADLQGRPSQPFDPIGSLQLTNLAPSALPSLKRAGAGPCFLGQLGSSFKRSCPRHCLFPFNLTPPPPFHSSPH